MSETPTPINSDAVTPVSARKKQIVIVEDDAPIALDLAHTLKKSGYEIMGSFRSGEDAIEFLRTSTPDLVLMDILLRGEMDGIDTATALHTLAPVPVVFLTALSDEKTLQRAKVTGPFGYLIKPFAPADLRTTIEVALFKSEQLERGEPVISRASDEDDIALASSDAQGRLDFLASLPELSTLSQRTRVALANGSHVATYEAGDTIRVEGDGLHPGIIVISGRVCLSKTNALGKELTLALLPPGSPFGLCLPLAPLSRTTAVGCQIDAKVLTIPAAVFEQIRAEDPAFDRFLVQELSTQLFEAYTLAMSLAHSRVETRIVETLLALLPRCGKAAGTESNARRLFMTRKELADLTGTTPETAIRVTKDLERAGLLDLSRAGIIKIPDVDKLRVAARET